MYVIHPAGSVAYEPLNHCICKQVYTTKISDIYQLVLHHRSYVSDELPDVVDPHK